MAAKKRGRFLAAEKCSCAPAALFGPPAGRNGRLFAGAWPGRGTFDAPTSVRRRGRVLRRLRSRHRRPGLAPSEGETGGFDREAILRAALGAGEPGAAEPSGEERPAFLEAFLAKHPHLADFTAAPSCALLRLNVETYILVTRFQHVVELHVV